MNADSPSPPDYRFIQRSGYLLGFAMGGFFDGILLHQILQWHHLLSAIQTGPLGSLRAQVTVDGWFHALMYVVAAGGLWQLYRLRALPNGVSLRRLWPAFLMGFGAWHIIDAVFSHWITGIHRIRMDSSVPIVWDLAWFVIFGMLPFLLGWRNRSGGLDTPGHGGSFTTLCLAVALIGAAAVVNIFPIRGNNGTTVVALSSGVPASTVFHALEGAQATIVWTGDRGGVWVIKDLPLQNRLALYASGALYVSGTTAPAGCAAWLQLSPRLPAV